MEIKTKRIITKSPKNNVVKELESNKLILYDSLDGFEDYWTLPLSTKKNNDKIIEAILYSNLD